MGADVRTYGTAVARARTVLQDTVQPYRYSDDMLYAALDSAVLEARRIRPDIFVGSLLSALPDITPARAGTALPIDNMFLQALVYYVVGSMELSEDEYTNEGRAVALLARFSQQLQVPG